MQVNNYNVRRIGDVMHQFKACPHVLARREVHAKTGEVFTISECVRCGKRARSIFKKKIQPSIEFMQSF